MTQSVSQSSAKHGVSTTLIVPCIEARFSTTVCEETP